MSAMNDYRGFKSTKFIITGMGILLSFIGLMVGKLDGALWVAGAIGLAVTYVTGDVKSRQMAAPSLPQPPASQPPLQQP